MGERNLRCLEDCFSHLQGIAYKSIWYKFQLNWSTGSSEKGSCQTEKKLILQRLWFISSEVRNKSAFSGNLSFGLCFQTIKPSVWPNFMILAKREVPIRFWSWGKRKFATNTVVSFVSVYLEVCFFRSSLTI